MTLCRLRVVQANSHSISIPHLVVFVKDLSYFEGVVYLLRRYAIWGVVVSLGVELVGFCKAKTKGQSVEMTLCPSLLGTQLSQEVSEQLHILDRVNLRLDLLTQFYEFRLSTFA